MKCLNFPRFVVRNWHLKADPEKTAWISIGEPEESFEHVQNKVLDKLPKLKISFQDLKEDQIELGDFPPSARVAGKIISFILRHPKKRFIVNCAAGISRSAAVCKFLEDYMGYKWVDFGKEHCAPNMFLYELLIQAYIGRLAEIHKHSIRELE